jgi:hypothetical protein
LSAGTSDFACKLPVTGPSVIYRVSAERLGLAAISAPD